jgi:hypothetical protein
MRSNHIILTGIGCDGGEGRRSPRRREFVAVANPLEVVLPGLPFSFKSAPSRSCLNNTSIASMMRICGLALQ